MTSRLPLLRVLIVDDELPAQMRLRDLLGDIAAQQPVQIVGFASNGVEALRLIDAEPLDVVLADIEMPLLNGIELVEALAVRQERPQVIFTTAHADYAVRAFEFAVADYLVKPFRAERLAQALARVRERIQPLLPGEDATLIVTERGRTLLLPVAEIIYLRADQKYVSVVTATREYLLDQSLVTLENELPMNFVRIHRNCLVARRAIRGVERSGESWQIMLHGHAERLLVSRRLWPAVRQTLGL